MPNPKRRQVRITRLIKHDPDVYSVYMVAQGQRFLFKPGQFLHLALDDFDPTLGYWPQSRVFSIASEPGADQVRITYAVKGSFTQRMSRELSEDRMVWIKYPYGDFIVRVDESVQKVVLVAGGTGITPFVPFLMTYTGDGSEVVLYYGVRRSDLLIYGNELKVEAIERPYRLYLFVEALAGEAPTTVPFKIGRLDASATIAREGCGLGVHYYLSGPPGMIASFRHQLSECHIELANIHVDAWE